MTKKEKDNIDDYYNLNEYNNIIKNDINDNYITSDKYQSFYEYCFPNIDLKKHEEDLKMKNERILEKIPIGDIERFLRKKKLEKLKKIN